MGRPVEVGKVELVESGRVELVVEDGKVEKGRFLRPDCSSLLASSLPECQQVHIVGVKINIPWE